MTANQASRRFVLCLRRPIGLIQLFAIHGINQTSTAFWPASTGNKGRATASSGTGGRTPLTIPGPFGCP